MTDFWPSIEDQLADLNRQATATLDRDDLHPEPPGLPAPGSWIRAMRLDDDARAVPTTPWHVVVGWNERAGWLSTRCRRTRPGALRVALDRFLSTEPPRSGRYLIWSMREWERSALLVEPERPSADVCGQCVLSIKRDAKREDETRDAEALAAFTEVARSLAADDSIDDAERGRRLRAVRL